MRIVAIFPSECALCFRPLGGKKALECECGAIVCSRHYACYDLHRDQQHVEAV